MTNTIHIILWPFNKGGHLLFAIQQDGHTFRIIEYPDAMPETYPAIHVPISELKICLESHIQLGLKPHTDLKRPGVILLIAPGKNTADGIEAMMFFENALKNAV